MLVKCPNCYEFVEILALNCRIFRHGVYKHNMEQISPHSSKIDCENLVQNDQIYGCGKPFKLTFNEISNKFEAIICDYI